MAVAPLEAQIHVFLGIPPASNQLYATRLKSTLWGANLPYEWAPNQLLKFSQQYLLSALLYIEIF